LEGIYNDVFEEPEIPPHIAAVVVKVKQGIRHELPGTVIGDVPPPFDLDSFDPELR
jgi:hypothetical protein